MVLEYFGVKGFSRSFNISFTTYFDWNFLLNWPRKNKFDKTEFENAYITNLIVRIWDRMLKSCGMIFQIQFLITL